MPSQTSYRPRLQTGRRRVPLTVSLELDTILALAQIGNGNRSAAIEELVRERVASPQPKKKSKTCRTCGSPDSTAAP